MYAACMRMQLHMGLHMQRVTSRTQSLVQTPGGWRSRINEDACCFVCVIVSIACKPALKHITYSTRTFRAKLCVCICGAHFQTAFVCSSVHASVSLSENQRGILCIPTCRRPEKDAEDADVGAHISLSYTEPRPHCSQSSSS